MSSDLLTKMDALLKNDVASRHSYFQMKYFIIGKEPTHQSKLWQCLRELKMRRESIKAIFLELEDTNDKLALLDIEEARLNLKLQEPLSTAIAERQSQELDVKETEIKVRRVKRQRTGVLEAMAQLRERLKNTEEEARFFVQAFEALAEIEPPRPYDDLGAQKEYWNARLTQDIHMRMLMQHPIDTELMKTVLALNNDAPIKQEAIHILDGQKAKLEMLKHKELDE
jgi:hypothetical protein